MNIKGFSHVTINVSLLEKSLEFYHVLLGMKLVHKGNTDAYLEWGDAWVCLLERPEKETQSDRLGVDHLAFFISTEEFSEAAEYIQSQGIKIVRGPETRGLGSSIYFLDPDGTQLELHTSTLAERMTVWK